MRYPALMLALAAATSIATAGGATAQQPRRLAAGPPVSSTLGAPGDSTRAGRPYQVWLLRADSAMLAEIVMRTAAFDAYLVLQDSAGRFLAFDDNGAGGRDARLIRELAPGSSYRVLARSLSDSVGEYSLLVRRMEPVTEGVVGAVTRGQTVTGELAANDPTLRDGRRYRAYTFDGAPGDSVQMDLTSDAFDTYLFVQDSVGRALAENDDFEGLNSRVVFVVPAPGRYRVVVSAFDRDAAGAYRLEVK